MHEISLVAELVEVCLDRAASRTAPVKSVHVRYASTVPVDGLRQAFEALVRGTPLAGATLEAEVFERVLDCPSCGFHGSLGHDDIVGPMACCPACAEVVSLSATAELELLELR